MENEKFPSTSKIEISEDAGTVDVAEESDPFAYLNRPGFSSEKFKIEVKNLPKIYGIGEFRKLLNVKLRLNSSKIKTPRRNSPYAFVCFRSERERDEAIETLNKFVWKGRCLEVIKAKPSPDPLVKKRIGGDSDNKGREKKIKVDERSQEEKLKSATIPLWYMPYDEQLQEKQNQVRDVLKQLGDELGKQNPDLKGWLNEQKTLHDGLPCELLDIRYGKDCNGYRNKCSFTVGIDEETKLPTVGFRIGSYVDGVTDVASVDSLKHIPQTTKGVAAIFQEYVRNSDLQVFNFENQTGHFRQLTVRTTDLQVMVIVGIHPQDLSVDRLKRFKDSLVAYLIEGPGKGFHITSIYYQAIIKKVAGEDVVPAEHLWGTTHLTESLLGLNFKISPEAFFQINTEGAKVLYESIIELADSTLDSTVLDVCCGTGTIGLCFARECRKVLGLEVVPQAIIDARENAKLNGITNAEFFEGKAEEMLGSICYRAVGDVVAVVDPPRPGLHQKAIIQIRKVDKIKRLVYVSCNPAAALKNFVDLGRPTSKSLHNEPLVPVRAVAVDMFPHTNHCELIVSFKRFDRS